MKLYDIKIQEEMELNKLIINYIKLMHQICNVNVFVIVNAKQYFSKNQLQYIYTSIIYENIYFINIEGKFSGKNSDERCIIIDEDLCLIEID